MTYYNHSIEALNIEAQEGRQKLLDSWLLENGVHMMSYEDGDELFNQLLTERSAQDHLLHEMKIDYLARRLDHQLNPTGGRALTQEELTANDFTAMVEGYELIERLSAYVARRSG